MSLKALFKNSWRTVWQNPFLWLFGLFSIFFVNNEISLIIFNFQRINNWLDQLILFKVLKSFYQQTLNIFSSSPGSLQPFDFGSIFITSLTVIAFILFICLSLISQISLVSSAKKSFKKERLTFSDVWQKGKNFFWPIAGIRIFALFITWTFLYLLSLPILLKLSFPIIVYIVLFLLLSVFISFAARFSVCFIVLKKEKFFCSIKKGFMFFLKNWLISIKMSVCLFLIAVLVGLALFLISLGTTIPFFALINLFLALNLSLGFWLILILWISVLTIIFLILGSIFSAWQFLVWALFFLKLSDVQNK